MANAKAWSNGTVRRFLSPHKPLFWDSPAPGSITRRSCPQTTRCFSGAGSMKSIPAGRFTGADGLRWSFGETGLMWDVTGSDRPCARWGSRGSIRVPILASGLENTRSTRTCFAILPPSSASYLGNRHHLHPHAARVDVGGGDHRLVLSLCRLLGVRSDP